MKYILTFAIAAFFIVMGQAQNEYVSWSAELVKKSADEYEVVLVADIEYKWFLYSQYLEEGGPIPTTIDFEESDAYSLEGKTDELAENSVEVMDDMFGMKLKKYKNKATFVQKIKSKSDLKSVKGSVEFMTCDDARCLPPEVIDFTATLK